MAAENKTKPTAVSVDEFLAAVTPAEKQADARVIHEMMSRLSGEPARMWGPTMIGYGAYHYRYETGREGDALRIGFSPRKPETVLYLMGGGHRPELLARLGKHRTGVACLYIKRLSDIDLGVLEEMIVETLAYMDAKYPR